MVEKMKERGMTPTELAKRLGITPGNVTRMLQPVAKKGYVASSYALRAGEIVGVPLPMPVGESVEEVQMLLRRLEVLSPLAYSDAKADITARVERLERAIRKRKP